ncbi:MAG TPA: hypothetical protein VFV36_01000 [Candidatus Methylomirabilis sp.]|nr:hypothetical protein [Candidatus Methylomirabilis sp.]
MELSLLGGGSGPTVLLCAATAFEARLLGRSVGCAPGQRQETHSGPRIVLVRVGVGMARPPALPPPGVPSSVTALLSVGLCGGLVARAAPGTVVVATAVEEADGGRRPCHAGWAALAGRAAAEAGIPVLGGPLLWSPRLLGSAEEKRAAAATGAVATDMESGPLSRLAAARGLPFAALRVVLDGPGEPLPRALPALIGPGGDVGAGRLLALFLRRPILAVSLLALAGRGRRALGALGSVLAGVLAEPQD